MYTQHGFADTTSIIWSTISISVVWTVQYFSGSDMTMLWSIYLIINWYKYQANVELLFQHNERRGIIVVLFSWNCRQGVKSSDHSSTTSYFPYAWSSWLFNTIIFQVCPYAFWRCSFTTMKDKPYPQYFLMLWYKIFLLLSMSSWSLI
jgi:hypothetical protein